MKDYLFSKISMRRLRKSTTCHTFEGFCFFYWMVKITKTASVMELTFFTLSVLFERLLTTSLVRLFTTMIQSDTGRFLTFFIELRMTYNRDLLGLLAFICLFRNLYAFFTCGRFIVSIAIVHSDLHQAKVDLSLSVLSWVL